MKAKFIPLIAVLAILCSCTPSKTNEGYEDYDWTALEKHLENPIKIPIDTMLDVSMKMRTLGDKVLMECPYRQVLYELKDNRLLHRQSKIYFIGHRSISSLAGLSFQTKRH